MEKHLGNEVCLPKVDACSSRERIYTLNVVVTGRCNAACTYCHYYARHDRKSVAHDISDELFETYMDFADCWGKKMSGKISCRFSGGDPMVLGDRLFQLADTGFRKTGMRPFVLTAGKALGKKWVEQARASAISHAFVSVENPIHPDPGAPNPFKVIRAIAKYDSPEFPIIPGVCVVPNNCFKHLYEICDWFYNEVGSIPLICEVNYSLYQSPTEDEWEELTEVLPRIINDFFQKTQLNLFSSVVPEYAYGGMDPYVFDLNLENSHKMDQGNYESKIDEFTRYLETVDYPRLYCPEKSCPWWKFCGNTKWYWQGDGKNRINQKVRDYYRTQCLLEIAVLSAQNITAA